MSRDGSAALPRGAMGLSTVVIVVFPDHTHLLFFVLLQKRNGRSNSVKTLDSYSS